MQYLILAGILFLSAFLYLIFRKKPSALPAKELKEESKVVSKPHKSKPVSTKKYKYSASKEIPAHSSYDVCLRSSKSPYQDFSVKGCYVGTCSSDGSLSIHKMAESIISVNAKFSDEPTAVSISSKGDVLAVAGLYDRRVHLFALSSSQGKRSLSEVKQFSQQHTGCIGSIECLDKYIISCGEDEDTKVIVWDYSGAVLSTFDNKQVKNKKMTVSPDARFLSIAAWIGSARVIEILTDKKTGSFGQLKIVMDLSGHTIGLSHIAFNEEATLAVSCAVDGSLRFWNINVRYQQQESTKLIANTVLKGASSSAISKEHVMVAVERDILLFNHSLVLVDTIHNAHTNTIQKLLYREGALYSMAGDGRINIFRIN